MTLAEYFEIHRYQSKYHIGDRLIGVWNKIPFTGSVGSDILVNETIGPVLSVFTDLPIMYKGKVYNIINVKHKDVKRLTSLNLEETNDKNTNRKASSKKPVLDSDGRKRKSR